LVTVTTLYTDKKDALKVLNDEDFTIEVIEKLRDEIYMNCRYSIIYSKKCTREKVWGVQVLKTKRFYSNPL